VPVSDPVSELSIDPDSSQFRLASGWLGQTGRKLGIPAEQIARLYVCLHEVLANVLDHGGASARSTPIGLRLQGGAIRTVRKRRCRHRCWRRSTRWRLPGPPRTLAEARSGGSAS
jgi:hypothetical protein